jgi:hypothetical protein
MSNAGKMARKRRQTAVRNFRAEGGYVPVRVEREEEVVATFDHRGHDRPRQRIIGVHQRVVCAEAVKLENKLHHFKAGVTD